MILGLLFGYLIYSKGVSDGIKLQQGREVKITNPITAIKNNKEVKIEKAKEEESVSAIENMLKYDGFIQKVGG